LTERTADALLAAWGVILAVLSLGVAAWGSSGSSDSGTKPTANAKTGGKLTVL
jgi:hypothetical protein